MCPACMSTLVLIAAGTGSAGGLTALIVKKLRTRNDPRSLGSKAPDRTPTPAEKQR